MDMFVIRRVLPMLVVLFSTAAVAADPGVSQGGDAEILDSSQAQQAAMKAAGAYALDAGSAPQGKGSQFAAKSVANGLVLSGPWTANWSGTSATLTVSEVRNSSAIRTTGTLRLELWATSSLPSRGQSFTGYKLAVSSSLNPLPPNTHYSNVVRSMSFTPPPDGSYWLVLLLMEHDSVNCTAAADNFCFSDTSTSDSRSTFGTPAPTTLTVISVAGSQCYQNYPAGAFSLLQQTVPGLFTSYSPGTTCASLGMSYFAGYLVGSNLFGQIATVSVYTPNQATAQFLCQSGFLIACTAGTASYNFSDLWWNPNESGWGVTITHHSTGIIFVTWFTYDAAGKPKWYVASNCPISNNSCTGTLYETTGPPFGPTYNPAAVSVFPVGSVSLTFTGQSTGTMSYNVNGITGIKTITRQSF